MKIARKALTAEGDCGILGVVNLGLSVAYSFSSGARYPPLCATRKRVRADREAVGEVFAKNIFYTNGFDLIHHPSDGPPSPKGKVGERGSKLTAKQQFTSFCKA